jgi:hypothetical protein
VFTRTKDSNELSAKYHITSNDVETLFSKEFWEQEKLTESSIPELLLNRRNEYDAKSFKRELWYKEGESHGGRAFGHDPDDISIVY